ncbi:MAG: NCS2 family permease [Cardiobacteriaceae bacterium]|nr:NCS2 family permease [Cardiobacteriaceae bacterium]
MFEKLFALKAHQTSIKTEVLAGLTTFLTMVYIIFVNPNMLAMTGMDKNAVFVATCLAAAVGCFIMGFYANLPVALAPGMGLNAFFTHTVVLNMGYSWQVALGCVFLSGVAFVLISLFKVREWIIQAIPEALKKSIAAGIGAFLAFIALQGSGLVVDNPATLVHIGNIKTFPALMTVLGFFLIVMFHHYRIQGSVILSIIIISSLGILFGDNQYTGLIAPPPSLAPTFFEMDLLKALEPAMLSIIFAFLFVDLFDTAGTLIGVSDRAGLTKNGEIPNLKKALLADSTATIIGAALGTSNTTSYVESTAGVAVGGRTGLTAVTVGILFLLATFFSPTLSMIPSYATTGAVLYVSVLMMYSLNGIDWHDISEAVPVALTFLMIPLTYSIADGISIGFISYVITKALCGQAKSLNIGVVVVAIVLLGRLLFL